MTTQDDVDKFRAAWDELVELLPGEGSIPDQIKALQTNAEALKTAIEALERAEEKFQRIQNVAMDGMAMARAMDGESEARQSLDRIEGQT